MKKVITQGMMDHARKQGYVCGLRFAHKILRLARNRQNWKSKQSNGPDNIDLKAEYEHGANLLHDLCLRVQEEIKKAKGT